MAGSGDLEIIRIIRYLRSRTGNSNSNVVYHVNYGSHMALHMALGLLFLGGGKYTLATDQASVAAMICAFFPKFPTHSNDNRYHLQALRHLYVLAAEPRLIIPKDVETGALSYCHTFIKYKDTPWYSGVKLELKAPLMLPELRFLSSVEIRDDRYHPVRFQADVNWNNLEKLLKYDQGHLVVKRRAGCVSYTEDPKGFRSLTAQCLTRDPSFQWTAGNILLNNFKNVPKVDDFNKIFLSDIRNNNDEEEEFGNNTSRMQRLLGTLLYECACQEKLDFLPVWIATFAAIEQLEKGNHCRHRAGQLALILTFVESSSNLTSLLSREISSSVKQTVHKIIDTWKEDINDPLKAYLTGNLLAAAAGNDNLQDLTTFLILNNIPAVIQQNTKTNMNMNPLNWLKSMDGATSLHIYATLSD